jgi:hypothetical protein
MRALQYLVAGLLLISLPAGMPGHARAATGGASVAGHWVAQLFFQVDAGANCMGDPICPLAVKAPGPVTFAPTIDIVSNAAGEATFTYEATIAGAGNRVSPECNAKLFATNAFTGLCFMTSHGTGYFDVAGANGDRAAFFVRDEWVTFHGTKLVREVHNPMAEDFQYPAIWPLIPQQGYFHDQMLWAPGATWPDGYHYEAVFARY